MTTTNALAVRPMDRGEWDILREQATVLVKTGFLPPAVNTPEKCLAIMLKARELNVPALYALSTIAIIQGKPTCHAELMLALIYRDQGDEAVMVEKSTETECVVAYKRPGWKTSRQHIFTMEDAKRAGITSNPSWQKYPAAMLRARCISAVARLAFPDSIAGMYTPEEMGSIEGPPANGFKVDEGTGEVLDSGPAGSTPPTAPAPATEGPPAVVSDRPVSPSSPLSGTHELKIAALRMGLGWTHKQVRDLAIQMTGRDIKNFSDLTHEEREELIEELDGLLASAATKK